MAFPRTLLLPCLIGLGACALELPIDEQSQPIINGEACTEEIMPETVALIVDAQVTFGGDPFPIRTLMCTGTLIAPDTVLTAAHCLDPAGLTGGFGTVQSATYYVSRASDLSALSMMSQEVPALPSDAIAARQVVAHEMFSLDQAQGLNGLANFYDIGLMFLETPLEGVEPAIVMTPEEAEGLTVGDEVRIAGWGQQTPEQGGPVGTKHCATTAIYETGEFELQIGNEPTTSRKCHGDSGGPTFITIDTDNLRKDRVIGITSRAYDSSDCQKGGVDTKPSAWYSWIDSHMKAQCESNERAWCDVMGVIDPSYYDEDPTQEDPDTDQSGGCSTGGSQGSPFAFFLLGLAIIGLRRRCGATGL